MEPDSSRRPDSSHRSTALVLLVLTALLWSSGGVLIKLVQWNAPAIAATRSFIAAVLMFALYGRRMTFRLTKTSFAGACAYAATVMLFVGATKLTTAASAILLQYTAPIYVALLSAWFLGERTTPFDWVAICVVIVGMSLFFLDGLSAANMLGNGLAMTSGLAFAWFTLLARKQARDSQRHDTHLSEQEQIIAAVQTTFFGNLLTACIGAPFAIGSLAEVSLESWMGLLALGIFQLGLSYILYMRAIRHVTALEAILIPVIEPLLNPVWAFWFTGERPGAWAVVGGAVVVAAIIARSILALRSTNVPSSTTTLE